MRISQSESRGHSVLRNHMPATYFPAAMGKLMKNVMESKLETGSKQEQPHSKRASPANVANHSSRQLSRILSSTSTVADADVLYRLSRIPRRKIQLRRGLELHFAGKL